MSVGGWVCICVCVCVSVCVFVWRGYGIFYNSDDLLCIMMSAQLFHLSECELFLRKTVHE